MCSRHISFSGQLLVKYKFNLASLKTNGVCGAGVKPTILCVRDHSKRKKERKLPRLFISELFLITFVFKKDAVFKKN